MNGEKIRRRLFELEMSPERLAAELEISMSTVFKMLKGTKVRLSTIRRAARLLELSLSELVDHKSHTIRKKAAS